MEIKKQIPVGWENAGQSQAEAFVPQPMVPVADKSARPRPLSFSSQQRPLASKPQKESLAARFFDGVAVISLVALFFGFPLFFTGMTLQGVGFEKQMYFYFWLLIGLIAWVAKGVILGEMKIRRTPLDLPIFIFLGAYVASLFFSVDRWHSFWGSFGDPSRGLLSVFALILAYYFIFSHFTPRRLGWMLGGLLVSSFVALSWVFLVSLGVHFLPASWEALVPLTPMGTIGSSTLFFGMTLPLFIVAISRLQTSGANPFVKVAGTVLSLIGLAFALFVFLAAYDYVSWWAVLIGFGFFLVYVLAKIVQPSEKWVWLPMLVLVLLLAFFMIGRNGLARVNFPVEATPNLKLSWQIAKESLKENFLVGSGPASYGYAFSRYYPTEYNLQPLFTFRFYQGSGVIFESLPTIGVLGTFVLVVLILSFLSIGLYLLSQGRENNKLYSLGLWSATLMAVIGGMIVPVNASLLIFAVLLAALALATLMWESRSEESYLQLSLKSSPKFALALAFIFIVVSAGVAFTFAFMGKAFWADVAAAKAMRQPLGQESINTMARSIQYMDKESRYYTSLGQMYMAVANQEIAKPEQERKLDIVKNSVETANRLLTTAKGKAPNDVATQEIAAQAYENAAVLAGNDAKILEQTQKEYGRASELEPNNPVFYLKLGQIKRALANGQKASDQQAALEDAKKLFETALEKKADFSAAYLNLGLVKEALKDNDGAISDLEKAAQLDRRDIESRYNLARLYRVRGGDSDLKLAEALLKDVLTVNDKAVNFHLNLGLVYEKMGKKDDAIASYQKVVDLLEGDNLAEARKQVQALIDNVRAGKPNNLDNPPAEETVPAAPSQAELSSQPATVPAAPSEVAPEAAPEQ
jgi:tetratricopeptide (TPR) repeat protein